MGWRISLGGGQGKEFQVEEFERQCQTNNLVTVLSKEVLMANRSQSMEYVTVFAQKVLFRRNGVGGVSQQQPCEIEDIMAVDEQLVIVPMGMEMITMMGLGEGSSNGAKMRKVRVPRRRGRKKLVK